MAEKVSITVIPAHAREDIIAKALARPTGTDTTLDVFPGKKIELHKVQLPIELPVYRMANGRTSIEQLDYLRREKRPDSFFSSGEENEQAQQVQHAILAELAKVGGDSIAVMMKVLREGQQSDPLWVTPRGVVVNGNRRLAAMRELYAESSKKFARYSTVECAVLPVMTPEQIEELEIRLQVAPETKLPYGWIHDCLLIEKRMNSGKTEEYVANLMGRRGGDVRAALAALQEVNIYLRDWRKSSGDYGLVEENGKQFFYDLPKQLKAKSGPVLEAMRRVGWILFDNGDDLGTRLYAFNKIIGDKAHDVLKRLGARDDVVSEDTEQDNHAASGDDDDLDIDLGDIAGEQDTTRQVLGALNDPSRREEVSAAVIAVCQTMFEAGRTSAQGQSTLRILSDIQTRLQEVDLTKAAPETHPGIAKQLTEIQRLAAELATRNQAYIDGTAEPEQDRS
jgi:hypothetical protein